MRNESKTMERESDYLNTLAHDRRDECAGNMEKGPGIDLNLITNI